jgi:PAS domain S-box-containing protein
VQDPDFYDIFAAAPNPYLLLAAEPEFTIVDVNAAYLAATLTTRERLVGMRLFDAFPDNPDDPLANGVRNLRASLERVIQHREADLMAVQKYDIRRPDGSFEERYWSPRNVPVLDKDRRLVQYIIHHVQDVTELVQLRSAVTRLGENTQLHLAASTSGLLELERRIETERALRKSEEQFRAFVTASSDIVYRMSANWSEMRQLQGRRFIADTVDPTRSWLEKYIPADERPAVMQAVTAAIDQKRMFALEHRVLRVDGTVGWLSSRAVPLLDGHGEITEWLGAATDITERKAAEEALQSLSADLQRQTRLFEQISSATPDFIYTFDLNGRFLYANRYLLEVWGRSFEDAIGKNLYELGYPQWHADMHMRELQQVIQTRQPIKGEVSFTGGSGISGIYEYIFVPVLNEAGEVELIAGTTRDVTDRRRAEQLLRAQNEALQRVVSGAPLNEALHALAQVVDDQADQRVAATIMLHDVRDGTLRTGAAPSLPASFLTAIDGIHVAPGVATCADAVARNEVVYTIDIANAPSWKGLAHAPLALGLKAAWSMPIRGQDGVLGAFTTYFRECRKPTAHEQQLVEGLSRLAALAIERRQAEAAREKLLFSERWARGEAERASRAKDEFLATLSHELRTPLNAILGWSQILMQPGRTEDDVIQGVRVIERNARSQAQIIEDLLDMSRIVSGNVRLDVQRLELAPHIRAAIDSVRPAAEAKQLRLHAVLDPLAGPVRGDPVRLQQIVWNLLMNAVKFTPKGGRIQVLLERVNSHLELSVSDNGEGIEPAFLPFVFDRFRQADASTTRRHGGLGLGLALVKQLVELHGGTVRAKSSGLGQGSTFTVMLPVMPVQSDDTPQIDHRRHPAADRDSSDAENQVPGADIGGAKVLVVDDEPDTLDVIRRLLESRRATVILASSAEEALRKLRQERPDVLVSDIGMPGEDGYGLIRRVRQLSPDAGGDTPAVALTAYARAEDRVQAILAGFQHHVAKPVQPAELIAMVASLVHR